MKKSLIALSVAFFALSANAQDSYFAQVDAGYVQQNLKLKAKGYVPAVGNVSESTTLKLKGFSPRLTLGKTTNDFDTALDFGYQTLKANADDEGDKEKIKQLSIGVSGVKNFKIDNSSFVPYVGLRASYNRFKGDDDSLTLYGVGVLGGTRYNLNDNVSLNLGAEANYLTTYSSNTNPMGIKISANGMEYRVKTGVRYSF